jgi:hypothetical protein
VRTFVLSSIFVLMLATATAFTQNEPREPSNPNQQEQTRPDRPEKDTASMTDEAQPFIRGCLAGTEDNYILTEDTTGKQYRLHSDRDMTEHLNQLVEVRGIVKEDGDAMARADERADLPQADQPADETTTPEDNDAQSATPEDLDVTDIKTVAETCLSPTTPPQR